MQNMDPAALQAQMAQAQAMMSGMSPDQLRSQFSMVLRPSAASCPPPCRARLCAGAAAPGLGVLTIIFAGLFAGASGRQARSMRA